MQGLLGLFGGALDLIVVIVAFGAIVFVHELGHFVAARWAGVRVTAFALGLGPAALSWRKGIGLRRGTSAREAAEKVRATRDAKAVGECEYRLCWFPAGGYVKMVGQEDLDPSATSDAPGSWQATAPWKRMVVISAGVVMNMIAAALLFVVVFSVGLKTEPALIGWVSETGPAARATPVLGTEEPGLRVGDRVVRINGDKAEEFNQLMVTAAMSRRGEAVTLEVARPGVDGTLVFEATPERGASSGLLELGIGSALSNTLDAEMAAGRGAWSEAMDRLGYGEIEPGSRIVAVVGADGVARATADGPAIKRALDASGGEAVTLRIEGPDGLVRDVEVTPEASLMVDFVEGSGEGRVVAVSHLLGLTPVMRVSPNPSSAAPRGGLEAGDVFARLGQVSYPALHDGIAEIRARRGGSIEATVLRVGALDGVAAGSALAGAASVSLTPSVDGEGRVGFIADTTAGMASVVARPPGALMREPGSEATYTPSASALGLSAGARIVSIEGRAVGSLREVAQALRDAGAGAIARGEGFEVEVTFETVAAWRASEDVRDSEGLVTETWSIPADEAARLATLGWTTPLYSMLRSETVVLRGDGVFGAMGQGFRRTKQVMAQTYLTLVRLFHGTVRVEHLRGPVGIAHLGTQILDRGFIWLLFFTALVSVNLAVINFLPLPIVDGGQFLFLVYEQIRGKAPPPIVQELSVVAGMVLIGSLFLIVTFNDLKALFGG